MKATKLFFAISISLVAFVVKFVSIRGKKNTALYSNQTMGPSVNHSYLCKRIIVEIEKTGKWEAWPELTLNIEGGLVPDIAIYKSGTLKPDFSEDRIRCDILPVIAVEIVSPSQSVHELMIKAGKFLKAGIPAVWTVEPYGGVIYVSTPEGRSVVVAEAVQSQGLELDFAVIFGKSV